MAFSFILDLWNKWNIRGFVLLSLSLQVILILFAPLRKKVASRPIIFLLWLAYLMADSVAAFAVGLISHNQGNSCTHVAEVDGAIQAFWASFLLLHLGGPDTITAFSLEDSSLWQRHLLSLIFQVGAAIYVFVGIFPRDKSLVIPTILVFLAGFIKIAERIWALYLSSFPKLRESMLLDNEPRMPVDLSQLLEELNIGRDECESNEGEAKLLESTVANHAYSFFQIFRIFIVDLIYTKEQRKMSIDHFWKVSAVDALRVISVELNFMYEELHTKALTIRHKWGYIFRIIAFTSVVMALGLFNRLKKYQLRKLDVKITHILLFGGIIIDGIALFNIVFSDWTVAKIKYNTIGSSKLDSFLNKLVSTTNYLRKPRYATCKAESNANVTYEVLDTRLIFRRWSESIFICNLFAEALKESSRKICKCNQFWGITAFKNIRSFLFLMGDKIICCGKRSMIAKAKYVSKNPLMKDLWIFIYKHVKLQLGKPPLYKNDKASMHKSIIRWHIATEICHNKEKQSMSSTTTLDRALVDQREFSKILSDYMLYLLLNQPNLMSDVAMVGIAQMVFTETLRELRDYIGDATMDLNGLCEKLYHGGQDRMPPGGRPTSDPNNPSKSLLSTGLSMAHQLEDKEDKWKTISDKWLGMLLYAAINIRGETHVQVLSKGGEFITFVWLLTTHLGSFFKPEWGRYREYWEEESADTDMSVGI
ncbi:hypothetical protein ACJRO7_000236 [Eucalyptus globulus]|uniref:DUF4220 domain-containing protein n=1 Tax=Eucalyptus globulus TaxID=34317 RepID=A0ABD3LMW4_EUCGL